MCSAHALESREGRSRNKNNKKNKLIKRNRKEGKTVKRGGFARGFLFLSPSVCRDTGPTESIRKTGSRSGGAGASGSLFCSLARAPTK